MGVNIKLITGATSSKIKKQKTKNKIDLLIGTQALLYERLSEHIDSERLALVIIDEQHRFGVSQRGQLAAQGASPHILSMTATPIPRTVALTLFSDLDLSVLNEKPVGRLPVKTWVVPESKRSSGYEWIKGQIGDGAQVFVVCPFIDPSEHDTIKTVKATTEEFEKLKATFSGIRLGMLHGKMAAKEKIDILRSMKRREIDLLVTTPVVEVGVDISDATIMVVEGAERFGLAQLHQLRGRVGRADKPSYCLLFTTDAKRSSQLKIMEQTDSGMALAHMDLKRRGPGELWGTAQHGWPTLRVADLTDSGMVQEAYRLAHELSLQNSLQTVIRERIKPHLDKKVTPN